MPTEKKTGNLPNPVIAVIYSSINATIIGGLLDSSTAVGIVFFASMLLYVWLIFSEKNENTRN